MTDHEPLFRVGDLVRTSHFRRHFAGPDFRGHHMVKTKKGTVIVLMVLGAEEDKPGAAPVDVYSVLKSMGWTPPNEIVQWRTKQGLPL